MDVIDGNFQKGCVWRTKVTRKGWTRPSVRDGKKVVFGAMTGKNRRPEIGVQSEC